MKKIGVHLLLTMLALLPMAAEAQRFKQLTNLPTVMVNTYDGSAITSRKTYTYARMTVIDGDSVATYDSLQIRGRGNSTWNMAKKPYRIKFSTKQKFLGKGYAKARSWTLLANCADKAMIRNALTSEVGKFVGLPFNPAAKFVDFYLNNRYLGTYQISDQVDVRAHRVNIYEQELMVRDDKTNVTGGYLLEATGNLDSQDKYFRTSHGVNVRIHSPSDSIVTRQVQYIKNYVMGFEKALYSDYFSDPVRGYRRYVDSTSLLNWYISNEVAANPDGFYSTYFYKEKDDPRLFWGPLWDNDISYNNTTRKGDVTRQLMADIGFGDGITKVWTNRFWEDAWFIRALGRRYAEVYRAGLTDYMLQKIDSLAQLLEQSQKQNYKVWNIQQRYYEEIKLFSTYDAYIRDLKTFVVNHNNFLFDTFCSVIHFAADTTFYYRLSSKSFPAGNLDAFDRGEESIACMYTSQGGRESQHWRLRPVGNYFQLIGRTTGQALADLSTTERRTTVLTLCASDTTDACQLWDIQSQGKSGYFLLQNVASGSYMNNRNGQKINNNLVISYAADLRNATGDNSQWKIVRDVAIPDPELDRIEAERDVDYALMYDPYTHEVHFVAPDMSALTFSARVYALNGRLVGTFASNESFDGSTLAAGFYIVSWQFGGKRHSVKFQR